MNAVSLVQKVLQTKWYYRLIYTLKQPQWRWCLKALQLLPYCNRNLKQTKQKRLKFKHNLYKPIQRYRNHYNYSYNQQYNNKYYNYHYYLNQNKINENNNYYYNYNLVNHSHGHISNDNFFYYKPFSISNCFKLNLNSNSNSKAYTTSLTTNNVFNIYKYVYR